MHQDKSSQNGARLIDQIFLLDEEPGILYLPITELFPYLLQKLFPEHETISLNFELCKRSRAFTFLFYFQTNLVIIYDKFWLGEKSEEGSGCNQIILDNQG